jgi:hypothetical protein
MRIIRDKMSACRKPRPGVRAMTCPHRLSPAAIEPLIGGTLALLSYYARSPNLAAADKIARNLALIARHPGASEQLQCVCTRLFTDWIGPLHCQDEPPERHWRDVSAEPAAMQ